MIEIGSGFSTLIAHEAMKMNQQESGTYNYTHICIEPYENKWLENIEVEVMRKVVEQIDKGLFYTLNKNDVLFIDSSHTIRPHGDVLFEYLEILPILNPGVLVHIHDIFTPKDYLSEWVCDEVRLWNEQYLLEAFLTFNCEYKVMGSLNYLSHHHKDFLSAKCPIYKMESQTREPGSFWLMKV